MTQEFKLIAGKPTTDRDPNDVLDYYARFTRWLDTGDTITSHTVDDVTGGITIASSDVSGGDVRVWVSGGLIGTPASFTVRIVTAGGRTKDQTLYFKVKKR
jgi:hypothetical protein